MGDAHAVAVGDSVDYLGEERPCRVLGESAMRLSKDVVLKLDARDELEDEDGPHCLGIVGVEVHEVRRAARGELSVHCDLARNVCKLIGVAAVTDHLDRHRLSKISRTECMVDGSEATFANHMIQCERVRSETIVERETPKRWRWDCSHRSHWSCSREQVGCCIDDLVGRSWLGGREFPWLLQSGPHCAIRVGEDSKGCAKH